MVTEPGETETSVNSDFSSLTISSLTFLLFSSTFTGDSFFPPSTEGWHVIRVVSNIKLFMFNFQIFCSLCSLDSVFVIMYLIAFKICKHKCSLQGGKQGFWSQVPMLQLICRRNDSRHSTGGGVSILRSNGHCPFPVCVLCFLLCSDFYIHRTITNGILILTFLVAAYVPMIFISNTVIVFLPWCKHKKGYKKYWKEWCPIH